MMTTSLSSSLSSSSVLSCRTKMIFFCWCLFLLLVPFDASTATTTSSLGSTSSSSSSSPWIDNDQDSTFFVVNENAVQQQQQLQLQLQLDKGLRQRRQNKQTNNGNTGNNDNNNDNDNSKKDLILLAGPHETGMKQVQEFFYNRLANDDDDDDDDGNNDNDDTNDAEKEQTDSLSGWIWPYIDGKALEDKLVHYHFPTRPSDAFKSLVIDAGNDALQKELLSSIQIAWDASEKGIILGTTEFDRMGNYGRSGHKTISNGKKNDESSNSNNDNNKDDNNGSSDQKNKNNDEKNINDSSKKSVGLVAMENVVNVTVASEENNMKDSNNDDKRNQGDVIIVVNYPADRFQQWVNIWKTATVSSNKSYKEYMCNPSNFEHRIEIMATQMNPLQIVDTIVREHPTWKVKLIELGNDRKDDGYVYRDPSQIVACDIMDGNCNADTGQLIDYEVPSNEKNTVFDGGNNLTEILSLPEKDIRQAEKLLRLRDCYYRFNDDKVNNPNLEFISRTTLWDECHKDKLTSYRRLVADPSIIFRGLLSSLQCDNLDAIDPTRLKNSLGGPIETMEHIFHVLLDDEHEPDYNPYIRILQELFVFTFILIASLTIQIYRMRGTGGRKHPMNGTDGGTDRSRTSARNVPGHRATNYLAAPRRMTKQIGSVVSSTLRRTNSSSTGTGTGTGTTQGSTRTSSFVGTVGGVGVGPGGNDNNGIMEFGLEEEMSALTSAIDATDGDDDDYGDDGTGNDTTEGGEREDQ